MSTPSQSDWHQVRSTIAQKEKRSSDGKFTKEDPPIVAFEVNNPVNHLRNWWQKVIGKEGIDIRFKIHPLTAIILVSIIAGTSFSLGQISILKSVPLINQLPIFPEASPLPTPIPARRTAFRGLFFQSTQGQIYLLTDESEAIILYDLPSTAMDEAGGQRVVVEGMFDQTTHSLAVMSWTVRE